MNAWRWSSYQTMRTAGPRRPQIQAPDLADAADGRSRADALTLPARQEYRLHQHTKKNCAAHSRYTAKRPDDRSIYIPDIAVLLIGFRRESLGRLRQPRSQCRGRQCTGVWRRGARARPHPAARACPPRSSAPVFGQLLRARYTTDHWEVGQRQGLVQMYEFAAAELPYRRLFGSKPRCASEVSSSAGHAPTMAQA